MFSLDPGKLLIIAVVAVILLGPDKLPQVARQAGSFWTTFNEFRHRVETEVRESIPDLPASHDVSRLARSPTALLNHLSNMATEGPAATGTADSPDAATVTPSDGGGPRHDPDDDPSHSINGRSPQVDNAPSEAPPQLPEVPIAISIQVPASDPTLN